jgi:hypothetical protein
MSVEETKELIVPLPATALEIYKDGGLDPILSAIEAEVRNHKPELGTAKGRGEIASLSHKVAKSKVYLDNLGKDLVSEWKKKSAVVDAERKRMRDKLDSLRDEARQPLTEWEQAEEKRVSEIREAINSFHRAGSAAYENAAGIQKALDCLNRFSPADDSFAELKGEAQMALDVAIKTLHQSLEKQRKHEADMAELERLRQAEEERKARELEEARKREETDRKARAENERQEREERIRREAEEKAKREAEERERRLIAEKERVEREAKQAAERAEREKQEAEARANRQAEEAARRERENIERQRLAEEAERKRREENTRIRNNVKKKAVGAMVVVGFQLADAEIMFNAIDLGQIPNISVRY